jgi:hypothetical protein
MKTPILVLASLIALGAIHLACTQAQREHFQKRFDLVAQEGEELAGAVETVAETGAAVGIPGAGAIALAASTFGTFLGIYNERRRGTLPLRNALTQVVYSVEAAFPDRTEQQKSKMASVQDQSTRQLVGSIKRS